MNTTAGPGTGPALNPSHPNIELESQDMSAHLVSSVSVPRLAVLAVLSFLTVGFAGAQAATPTAKPAEKCLGDLTAFDTTLQKDGYWFHGSGYGYGYPLYALGAEHSPMPVQTSATATAARYSRARPGYEIRTLLASANILAQRGDQQGCESLLSQTRDIYTSYAAQLRSDRVAHVDSPRWRREQIASAVPVTSSDVAYRSDELVGAGVVNPAGDNLGSIDDIVMSPQTGKIAYLVIGRGGIFGIGEKYVPVPWGDFKAAPGAALLVLDTGKAALETAPQVKEDQAFSPADFATKSQKVDDYWMTHLPK
jgi:sporulation protein YlmC with PRC-barrel domain